jgi:hypothetical protein
MCAACPEGLSGMGTRPSKPQPLPLAGQAARLASRACPDMPISLRNKGGIVTYPQHHDVQQVSGGIVPLTQEDQKHDNPIVHHLSMFKTRARMLDDSRVEAKAQQLQATSSYDDWEGLSDADKELWRHMARLEFC